MDRHTAKPRDGPPDKDGATPASTTTDTSPTTSKDGAPSLLTMPAEIRNRIYAYALAVPVILPDDKLSDSDHADMDVLDFKGKHPALLRACRQTRREAISLYYENEFLLILEDFDSTRAIEWIELAAKYVDRKRLCVQWDWKSLGYEGEEGTGTNILELLRYAHADRMPPFNPCTMWQSEHWNPSRYDIDEHLERLFGIARDLSAVPWETVRSVLERYAEGTAIGNLGMTG